MHSSPKVVSGGADYCVSSGLCLRRVTLLLPAADAADAAAAAGKDLQAFHALAVFFFQLVKFSFNYHVYVYISAATFQSHCNSLNASPPNKFSVWCASAKGETKK